MTVMYLCLCWFALLVATSVSAQSSDSSAISLVQQANAIVEETGITRQLLKEIAQNYGDDYFAAPLSLQRELTQATQAIFQGTIVNDAPTDTLGSSIASSKSLTLHRFNESFALSHGARCLDGSITN
jgi:hypothetical protein